MIISVTYPSKEELKQPEKWFVYILECSDNTLYTGITNNLEKRIKTHNNGKGAKYTRIRRPVILRYFEKVKDKSSALKREFAIKKMTRQEKRSLIGELLS